jgi:3-oxoacyl-[acyl-carrier-protein] synthase-3
LAPDYANIVSTGSYLPEIEITDDALRARSNGHAPDFVDKMEASSGILARWAAPAEWAARDAPQRYQDITANARNAARRSWHCGKHGTRRPDAHPPHHQRAAARRRCCFRSTA